MDRHPLDYDVWHSIKYCPTITDLEPDVLRPYLKTGLVALDVGCNTGNNALWLARHGLSVLGIDINAEALEAARCGAVQAGLHAQAEFKLADITRDPLPGTFDLILLVRLLTCIPSKNTWTKVLTRVYDGLCSGGLIYVHDFLRDDEIAQYHQRYVDGEVRGWRSGNFAVNDPLGRLFFIAHHHTRAELEHIMEPYSRLKLAESTSLSMHGNECRMFQFVGRKP